MIYYSKTLFLMILLTLFNTGDLAQVIQGSRPNSQGSSIGQQRGLYWDSQGNEIYAPPPAPAYNAYPYSNPFYNPSYYPDYDQYNSPQYNQNQQPSKSDQATFPYHPV